MSVLCTLAAYGVGRGRTCARENNVGIHINHGEVSSSVFEAEAHLLPVDNHLPKVHRGVFC